MIYGYAKVGLRIKKGDSIDEQIIKLSNAGCNTIIEEQLYIKEKGKNIFPRFNELLHKLNPQDTLIVTKLDKFARNTREGFETIQILLSKNITVVILNMGTFDNTHLGKALLNMFLAFAEFEIDMLIERTQEGKAIAAQKEGYKEGRKPKFTDEEIENALSLLSINGGDMTYHEVSEKTGISKSTLIRAMNVKKRDKLKNIEKNK